MTQTPYNDLKTLETALTYVARLVDELDRSTDPYGILYEPEILTWAVEQLNPEVLRKLQRDGLTDVFRRRLAQLGELRKVAQSEVSLEYSPPYSWAIPSEWPSLDYMADVLDSSAWQPTDRSAKSSLRCVLRNACELPRLSEELKIELREREGALDKATHPKSASSDLNTASFEVIDGDVTDPLSEAMNQARRLLLAGDDGTHHSYWDAAEAQVVAGWVQDEIPLCVSTIRESGQEEKFLRQLTCYIRHMAAIAAVCNRLGDAVVALLLTSDAATALKILGHAVRVYARGDKSSGGTATEVLSMLQRRNCTARDCHYLRPKLRVTCETSDAIDAIRHHEFSQDACFIVPKDRLPAPLKQMTDEKWCLAVTLPPEMRRHVSPLCVDNFYMDSFFTKTTGSSDAFDLRLSISPSFWCDLDALWSMLSKFRGSLPVVYVFDNDCVLVSHRFNACVEMRAICQVSNKHRRTVSINDDDWSQWLCDNCLPPGSRLKPRILNQVIEF